MFTSASTERKADFGISDILTFKKDNCKRDRIIKLSNYKNCLILSVY